MEGSNKSRSERLRFIREYKKETQESFADKLELSVSAYKKLESGENNISLKTLDKLHEFNISSDFLLYGSDSSFEKLMLEVQSCTGREKMLIFISLMERFRDPQQKEDKLTDEELLELIRRYTK